MCIVHACVCISLSPSAVYVPSVPDFMASLPWKIFTINLAHSMYVCVFPSPCGYLVCRILWQVEIRWLPGMSLVSLYNHSTILQTKIIITITNINIIINNDDTIMVLFQHWYVGKQVSEGRRCLPNHNVDLVGDTIINEYIMNRAKHKTSSPIWRCLCGNKQGACPVIGKVPLCRSITRQLHIIHCAKV